MRFNAGIVLVILAVWLSCVSSAPGPAPTTGVPSTAPTQTVPPAAATTGPVPSAATTPTVPSAAPTTGPVTSAASTLTAVPSAAPTTGPVTSRATTPAAPASTAATPGAAGGKGKEEHPVEVSGEFENALSPEQTTQYKVARNAASNGYTLRLTDNDADMDVSITLCVQGDHDSEQVRVGVSDIVYSNDGPADTIVVDIDGMSVGTVVTEDNYQGGSGWNVFKGTGVIGEPVALAAGNHTLVVYSLTDQWGIELDYIDVKAYHQNKNVMILCDAKFGY